MPPDQFKITPPNRYHPHSAKAVLVQDGRVLTMNVALADWFLGTEHLRVKEFMERELKWRVEHAA